jgi:hypothetical protein
VWCDKPFCLDAKVLKKIAYISSDACFFIFCLFIFRILASESNQFAEKLIQVRTYMVEIHTLQSGISLHFIAISFVHTFLGNQI